jgi:hypothetical protein
MHDDINSFRQFLDLIGSRGSARRRGHIVASVTANNYAAGGEFIVYF